MSDPFAMFAQDVKAAVPEGEAKQQGGASAFDPAKTAQPPAQPIMTAQPQMTVPHGVAAPVPQMAPPMNQPSLVPMNSPVNAPAMAPTSPSGGANPFAAPVSPTAPAPAPVDPFAAPTSPPVGPAAVVPYTIPTSPHAVPADPFAAPTSPPVAPDAGNPFGAGVPPPGAVPPSAPPPAMPPQPPADPFGAPGAPPAPGAELVPAPAQANPWGVPEPSAQPPAQPTAQPPADPWGVAAPAQQPPAQPPAQPAADPFGVFNAAPAPAAPAAAAPAPQASSLPSAEDEMWAEMGFDPPSKPKVTVVDSGPPGDVPEGGEYYDVKIFTPTLGIVFFRPQELKSSLYSGIDQSLLSALGNRPVVAHILEGSSARSAKIELGHILLKVNDTEVYDPDQAAKLIKESPRPLPLLFYVPDTKVVTAEGDHMVKYDTPDTKPPTIDGWKRKYVVVGGIVSKPWLINMYRSKEEYDVAVIETMSGCKVSVKVKQFSMLAGELSTTPENRENAMLSVKYKNKIYPWRYFMMTTPKQFPVKISSPTPADLLPVMEGVVKVLKEFGRETQAGMRAFRTLYHESQGIGDGRGGGARSPASHGSHSSHGSGSPYPSNMMGANAQMNPYAYDGDGGVVQRVESY